MVRLSLDKLKEILNSTDFPFHGLTGSIVRLKIEDFMTYRNVELHAGPSVNVVVGPNGSGKSSLVCAICVALAGNPKILGRASCLKEYIRHGACTATVEIELYSSDNPKTNWVVKRVIKEKNGGASSDWYLNGVKTIEKHIIQRIKSLNVQVDNLCCFLPQDRIQDFTNLDKVQLLKFTESSVGNQYQRLAVMHERVVELQIEIRRLEAVCKQNEEQLSIEISQNKGLEQAAILYSSREKIKQQINALEGKMLWLLYQKSTVKLSQIQAQHNELSLKMQAEENILLPFQTEFDEITMELSKLQRKMAHTGTCSETLVDRLYKDCCKTLSSTYSDVSKYMAEQKFSEKNEKERQSRLKNLQDQLSSHRQEWQQLILHEAQLSDEMEQVDTKRSAIHNEILETDILINSDRVKLGQAQKNLRTLQSEFEDMRSSRLKFLKRKEPDTARAVEYFANAGNLAAAHLKGKLHEPPILSIQVNDLEYGKVAEKCLRMSDLVAFYVEDKEDVQRLLALAQSEGMPKISIIHHKPAKNFHKPQTQLSEAQMRKYGFQKRIIDLIQATDYYMSYLIKSIGLQDVLIHDDLTDSLLEEITNESSGLKLTSFFTKVMGVRIGWSKYRPVSHCTTFYLAEATIFTNKIDAQFKETKTTIENEIQKFQQTLQNNGLKRGKLLESQKNLQASKIELEQKLNIRSKTESKLRQCESMIACTEEETVDIASVKKEVERKIKDAHRKSDASVRHFCDSIEQIAVKWYELNVYKQNIKLLQKVLIRKQNHLDEAKIKFNSLKNEAVSLEKQVITVADTAKNLKEAAKDKTKQDGPPLDVINGALQEADGEKEISKLNGTLAWMPEANVTTFNNYRDGQMRIEEMSKSQEDLKRDLKQLKAELQQTKDGWLPLLEKLIHEINYKFGDLFSKINHVGEVSLDTGVDENDYSKYGVSIKVKFRAAEPIAELVGFRQSGGERAISTALYVLSLQQLTSVPFLVIDEINQGMDSKNEKKFFDLVCSLSEAADTPQIFMFSPKPTPPVNFFDNVEYHLIMNGPYVNVEEEGELMAEDDAENSETTEDDDDA